MKKCPDEAFDQLRQNQLEGAFDYVRQNAKGGIFFCSDGQQFSSEDQAVGHEYNIRRAA